MKFNKNKLFTFITFIFVLIFIEIILSMFSLMNQNVKILLSRDSKKNIQMIPKFIKYEGVIRPNPKHHEHDFNGFRNKNIPKNIDLITFGDSQTYGSGVKREETWPAQISKKLKIISYNMGIPQSGPCDSFLMLNKAISLAPKIIVHAVYSGNDSYDCFNTVYGRDKIQDLKATNNKILELIKKENETNSLLKLIKNADPSININYSKTIKRKKHNTIREFFAENSKIYGFFRSIKRFNENFLDQKNRQLIISDWTAILNDINVNKKNKNLIPITSGKIKTILTPDYRNISLDFNDLRIKEGFRICLEVIKEINEKLKSNDINYIVLLVPTKEFLFKNVSNKFNSMDRLSQNENVFWLELKNFCKKNGIEVVDSYERLHNLIIEEKLPYSMNWDGHLNPLGHRTIAELLLPKIKSIR